MPNEIDLVVGQVAFDKITELIGRLKDVDTEFSKIADKFSNLGKTSNPQSTAELAKLTAENEKLNKALNDLKSSYTTIDTELAKNTKLITDNTLATKAQTAAETLKLKATEDQNSAYVKAAGLYANLDAQHKLAVKNAQDLAVATGRTGIKYEEAKNKANELGKQLRVIDTDIGKHTRNVGNYSSSWNGLGNSINQLTREAPAFANSVQTGFMALSNNIPILTDELGVLIAKNKQLQADGKPTESILKTVAGAFFSWQTAISLGVTILTVYGAKIWEMITADTEAVKSKKLLTDAMKEGAKDANAEVYKLDVLYKTTQNLTISIEQRKKAVDQLQKQYPFYFENLKDEDILLGKAKVRYIELKEAIIASSRAKAISARMDKLAAEEFDKETEMRDKLEEAKRNVSESKKEMQRLKDSGANFVQINREREFYNGYLRDVKFYTKEINTLQNNLSINSDKLLQQRTKDENKAANLEADRAGKGLKVPKEKTETKSKADKDAKDAAKKEEENAKNKYNREISDLNRSKELIQDKYDAEEEGTRMRISLSNELALSQINIIEAQYNEQVRLAKNNADLIKIADNNLATARENILRENGKRIIAEQEKNAPATVLRIDSVGFPSF